MTTQQQHNNALNIAGWTKLSTVDWPGNIVATIFLQGCPWRCSYCHNWQILDAKVKGPVQFGEVLEFLRGRVGLLDGVVFSGGEALMQAGEHGALLESIREIRAIKSATAVIDGASYKIGLHTGGAYPENLRKLLPYLDWIGFDVKAPTGLYGAITHIDASEVAARKSLNLVLAERERRKNTAQKLDIQFRTTVDPMVLNDAEIARLKDELAAKGIDDLVLQTARTQGAPDRFVQALKEYEATLT
jgi:pyruvate formate lyase activating enzyme